MVDFTIPITASIRPRIAVYTALLAAYDDLKPYRHQTLPADFYCFTDTPQPDSKGWSVRMVSGKGRGPNPRMQSKWFKMHAHQLFRPGLLGRAVGRRAYDYAIWIDASMEITSPEFVRDVLSYIGGRGVAIHIHPWRDCIYEEAKASIVMPKYDGMPILEQVESYRREGFPEHGGLVASGLIARDLRVPLIRQLDEAWWAECLRWTYQDQLSWPVVAWRAGHRYGNIPGDVYASSWFRYTHHHRDD